MVMACTTSFVQLMMVVTSSRSQKRVSSECETRTDLQGTLYSEHIFYKAHCMKQSEFSKKLSEVWGMGGEGGGLTSHIMQ